jgi:hypothetical protein
MQEAYLGWVLMGKTGIRKNEELDLRQGDFSTDPGHNCFAPWNSIRDIWVQTLSGLSRHAF